MVGEEDTLIIYDDCIVNIRSAYAPGDKGKKPEEPRRRRMVVSEGWVQGIALVMILGFTVMGILACHTYNDSIPIPDKVVSTTGEVLFTHDDIVAGQEAFNNRGLMEYGSIIRHGGYLAPDLTADYLRRSATLALDARIKARENQPHQANIKDPAQARHLTDFFAWTAWDGRGSTWLQLFVHKQLAGRPDRGEPSNGRHGRLVGVVREEVALGVTYMDLILYSAGGVLGTMHHLYFSCPRARTWPSAPSSRPRRPSH